MTAVLGIDPGVRGGMAVVDSAGGVVMLCGFRPDMADSTLDRLVDAALRKADVVFIEKTGFKRGDGGKGAFTFGRISGLLAGLVHGHGKEPRYVSPMLWQSVLCCLSGGNKNVTKNRAIELYPARKDEITHATADALLIARYGWLRARADPATRIGPHTDSIYDLL